MVSNQDEHSRAPETPPAEAAQDNKTIHIPRPSYWPLVLTLAIMVAVAGLLVHPAITVVGALGAFVAIVAWGLEGGN